MKRAVPQWTLVTAAIAALLNWLVGFQLDFLSAKQAALWMVLINAVAALVTALKTRPIPPNVFAYVIASAAAVLGAYGLAVNQEHVATFTDAVIAILALVANGYVNPKSAVTDGRAGAGRL